jgi:hypothetical protein
MDVFFVFFLLQRRGFGEFKVVAKFGFLQTKALGFSVVWGGEQELLLLEHGQEIFSTSPPFLLCLPYVDNLMPHLTLRR